MHEWADHLVDVGRKGNLYRISARNIDAPNLSAVRGNDGSGIGSERRAWPHVASRTRFQLVVLDLRDEPAVVARDQAAQDEPSRRGAAARSEDQPPAAWAHRRCKP